ncbi:non-ribosomal peptide synthase/polyketide synthase, partial [Chryseobacterium sp. YR221]|uniref:non-ribosomal peptide synthase/polyketide synthase n=1 Tax=Chryseobacterium sp. YR221 TaxID=1500293 RepID=UPI0009D8E9E2
TYMGLLEDQEDLSSLVKEDQRHIDLGTYRHIQDHQHIKMQIEGVQYHTLKSFTKEHGFTVNAVLQYLWHKQLSIYSGLGTSVVGTTVSGRSLPVDGIESSAGLYINTLPLIVSHEDGRVVDQITEIQNRISELNTHSDINLAALHHDGRRIFSSLFVYENYPVPKGGEGNELGFVFMDSVEKLDYPLGIVAYERGEEVSLTLNFEGYLFDYSVMERLIEGMKTILTQLLKNPKIELKDLSYITADESVKIMEEWNDTDFSYPNTATVPELFEMQVEKTPDNIALLYQEIKLTYRELNERVNRLANYLIKRYDLQPDDLVPLCLERSEDMLIAILGVIKAGAAYVPIDPSSPVDRIKYILEDTDARVVLAQENTIDRIQDTENLEVVSLDGEAFKKTIKNVDSGNPITKLTSRNLVYVIYTSGTTGMPKGVMVEHRNIINLIKDVYSRYQLRESDVIFQFANYVFDPSIEQILMAVLNGNPLLFIKDKTFLNEEVFLKILNDNNASYINLTPSVLQNIDITRVKSLTRLASGGEALTNDLYAKLVNKHFTLINCYGPTETTVTSIINMDQSMNSIGRPIGNMKAYILDSHMNPVPVGALGELYIGGAGITRGYLNRPELTQERFIANPFQTEDQKDKNTNARLYKTGDLVRWLPAGNIEYIGRNDFQVKIRGYRIELGEIENRLLQYPGIRQVAVLAKENNTGLKYIVGYYVADSIIDSHLLSEFLSETLPEYMVPVAFVHLVTLPVTVNGKLDRKQLPEPGFIGGGEYTAPENELQQKLCQIYGEVLGINAERISIHDDFFRLGGNSIMSIKLISKIKQNLALQVDVAMVFTNKTVASLEKVLRENTTYEQVIITPVAIDSPEEQRLSFAQERLWFIETYEGGSSAYNIPMTALLDQKTDIPVLCKALEAVIVRHEILRSVIRTTEDGTGYQVVTDLIPEFKITEVETREELDQYINKCANRIFRLDEEIPVEINIFKLKDQHYMSMVIHHIAFDGWSTDIFLKEIQTIYRSLINKDNASELPALQFQYKDFAIWQRHYLAGELLDQQIGYWKDQLDDFQNLDLATDFKRPSQISYEGENLYFSLNTEQGEKLKKLSKELGVSLYSVMLSGYYLMLSAYSGQDDIVVGSPIANRHHAGLEDIIGFFVNTLALREKIDAEQNLKDFILQVSKSVTEAQSHQDLPFEKLVEELGVEQDTSRHPVFQVMFGLQNFGGDASSENNGDALFYPFDGEIDYQVAKFDLTTMIDDGGENIHGMFNYAKAIFSKETVGNMIHSYEFLLNQIAETEGQKDIRLSELNFIPQEQYKKVTEVWNTTHAEYQAEMTVHQLFENQVLKTPDQTALVYQDVQLSYRELNERSNRLANYLIETYNLQPDDIIPLCLDRSEHMLIAVLAVMKAGAAYVPMDPSYPVDRIKHILQDTNATIVLTEEKSAEKISGLENIGLLSLDNVSLKAQLEIAESKTPVTKVNSGNLAYVIYTSGTTGLPKGVMIEHSGVINLIESMIKAHRLEEFQEVGCYSNYVFDAFVYEAFPVLCNGNTLWLYSNDLRTSVSGLNEYIKENNIEVSFIPPVLLREVVDNGTNLKLIFAGGESFPALDKNIEDIILVNEYGPTEGTVCATLHYYKEDNNPLNIGGPIANATAYVLDSQHRAVPVGAVGELYIGGAGIARGYLNQPELTEERFLDNPFQTLAQKEKGENSRLYKTGDLVRWLSNGELEYVGRNDFQVKIRGYRIELGEIENILLDYPGIRQTAVLAKENKAGLKYLAGYYVSDAEVDSNVLSEHLSASLPEYMVPSAFVHLTALPLTINGKLDRKQLPEPEFTGSKNYVAPETELQTKLCYIYGEVLGLDAESISIHDDFFRLGGNSIMAIKLISKIKQVLDIRVEVAMIFSHKTIASLSHILADENNRGEQITITPVEVNTPEEQRLSFAQERLWFIENYEGGSSAYNIPMIFRLDEKADISILCKALDAIIMRHEVLRSVIRTTDNGIGWQSVVDDIPAMHQHEVKTMAELEEKVSSIANKIFRLEEELPVDINIFKLEESYYLSIVIHHIAFDGWSTEVFLKELIHIYNAITEGRPHELPGLKIQYKDFALWQRNYLTGERLDQQISYWKNKLSGFQNLDLAADFKRPSQISYDGENLYFSLDAEQTLRLKNLSKDLGVSLYSIVLGGYYLTLSAYSGQDDIIVGSPIANRHHVGLEDMIGFFVNTLALRENIDPGQRVKDFILQVAQSVTEAQSHQDLPFEKLVEELGVEQDTSRHPVFQVMFGLQSFGEDVAPSENEKTILHPFNGNVDYQVAKFDITTMINDIGETLQGMFNYAKAVYSKETVKNMMNSYLFMLDQIAGINQQENLTLSELNLIPQDQYTQLSRLWSTESDYASDITIQALFEAQVERTPDHIAIVYQDVRMSYRELNDRSNRLAHYLIETYDLQPDDLVPLCLERSADMLTAILGVLKAGGAYVPMDPSYPVERIRHILEDTGAKIVLAHSIAASTVQEACSGIATSVLVLNDAELERTLAESSVSNPVTEVGPDHLAYVIYTSGTTGMPKGVMQIHRNVARLFSATDHWYHFNDQDVWSLFHSYVFDFSVWEIWGAFFYGGKLLVPSSEQTKDTNLFFSLCLKEGLTVLNQTPTAFYQFIDTALQRAEDLSSLRYVIFGGEALNLASLKPWYERYRSAPTLINMYGITETTVHVTYKKLSVEDLDRASLIGENIPDQGMYILDNHLRAVPIGAVGELYVGGAGIARGYLNRAELTAERFIANPFQTLEEKASGKNGILYKTGDLVRYLSDGELEYIGRNDFQVKIRGYRIELGEIENRLQEYAEVRQSVVLAKENKAGMKYLVGYYVSDTSIDTGYLTSFLSEALPEYMVPAAFVHLTSLPLTINGKLDRRQLPEPEFTGGREYTAPENELQERLCQIYGEVLGLDAGTIGINDDFFSLGGNSIMAIKLISGIKRTLNTQVGVAVIFGNKTVASLSNALANQNNDEQVSITPVKVNSPEEQRLSFAQERLWFIETYEGGSSAYNIPMTVRLNEKTDISALCKALETIVMRHEVLRSMILSTEEGKGYQLVTDRVPEMHMHHVETRTELDEEINRISNKVFRLDEELPIEVNIFRLGGNHYLSVVIHHIAFDGWSTDIFLQEIQTAYEALINGKSPQLPELKIQYKDFALWQRNYLTGDRLNSQLGYWKSKLDDFQNLNLPADFKRPPQVSYEGETINFTVDPKVAQSLRNTSRKLGVSLYSVMLGGYYLMLSAYSGQDDIVVGSPIANRHHAGLEDIIGFFVNTLALRENINPEQNLRDFILQVSKSVTEAQSHQDLPFEKLVEELGVEQDTSRHPVFQVMFGLQSFGRDTHDGEALFSPFEGEVDYQVAKFDLTTMIDDGEETIRGMFNYGKTIFARETVNNMIGSYQYILEQAFGVHEHTLENVKLCDLPLVPADIHKKITEDWNATASAYEEETIHTLFENQVSKTPDHIALVYQDVQLSYRELNERANRLANYLIGTYNIQPDDIIPLCLERSENMLIAILAVLKSGAAYVPMDPSYPVDRIEHILQDTGARLILGQESTAEKVQNLAVESISLDDISFKAQLELTDSNNPVTSVTPENLAYVIYTSGTTGLPKGVMVEHRNVANLIQQEAKEFGLISDGLKNCLWYANYVFDAHVWELYPVITHGHSIYILDKEKQTDIAALQQYIETNHIRIATIPPVLLTKDYILPLEKLVVAGDVTNPQLMALYQAEGVDIINAYGPTEGTVCATLHHYNEDGNPLNIGGPIGNMTSYVLDNHMRAVPVGAVGELYIGGAGIARGYLNRPDLTEERFILNPFQTEDQKTGDQNERLYKTGDLVRWLANGELEYIGRNDFQVKIRGYRIELGEIENTLLHYPGVRQVAVLAKENKAGLKYLAGYYVSDSGIDSNLLSDHLSASLPEYMVPGAFVHLTALPLTINGKLDRKQLPEPEFTGGKDYIAPKTDLQVKLCQIYGDVLGLDAKGISIEDDFFRLGGDSIISIQLVGRIRQQLDIRLSVKEVFTARTAAALSLLIEEKSQNEAIHILAEQGILDGKVSLLPIQEWFFSQKELGYLVDFNHWNQAFLINVPQLNKELLEKSVRLLIEKHDAFRIHYPKENGMYSQQYGLEATPEINYLDTSGKTMEELSQLFTQWHAQFDIEKGPLYRIAYITGYEDGSTRIFFAFHHLIIDTVSWRIITDDLKNIYQTLERGEDFKAAQKGSSYRQWVDAVKGYKKENPEARDKELVYWNKTTEIVHGINKTLEAISIPESNHDILLLDKENTEKLIRGSHHVYQTRINDLLLSALASALTGLTGESRHAVLLESHGREDVFPHLDITETLGWFTSMYPLLLETGKNLNDTVVLTKEALRSIPDNGIGYGSLVGYTQYELPKISFNYLGQLDQEDSSAEKAWFIAAEDSGLSIGTSNKESYIIGINGAVVDGQLRFSVSAHLPQDLVKQVTQKFKEYIIDIIDELSKNTRSFLTPSDIENIVDKEQLDAIQENGEVEGVFLANSLQEGFVYHALKQGDTDDAYRVQLIWDYLSEMNVETLKKAWFYTQQQFPALRLRFNWSGEIVQIIDKESPLDWRFEDLSGMKEIQQEELIRDRTHKDRFEVYDLSKGGLFRIYMFKRSEKHYTCLFSNHHAVLDGWSMPIVLKSIHDIYLNLIKKQDPDFVLDHAYINTQKYLQQHKDSSRSFWNSYMSLLQDQEDLSSLMKESQRHIDLGTYRQIQDHQFVKMTLADDQYQQLKKFTTKNGFTVNAVLQYLWHSQLGMHSGVETTVVGTTVSGRSLPVDDIESSAGLFINTLPLIVEHTEGKVVDIISDIQQRISELNTHSDVSLGELQHDARRMFSSLFVYENYPVPTGGDDSNELGFIFKGSVEKLDYPLGIMAYEQGESVTMKINYEGVLFETQTMEQLMEGMKSVLRQVLDNWEITSDQLSYVSENQLKVIESWNHTVSAESSDKTIHELFENQVSKTPDHIALVYQNVKLSYSELNNRANRLANYLIRTYDLQPDDLIPLCLERSEHMLIAILAVLKAGAAYVPMDPSYPADRIEHILHDTGAKLVLGDEETMERVQKMDVDAVSLDQVAFQDEVNRESSEAPVTTVTSDNLAYVIYTSGTTGLPKGVMIEHRNVVNLIEQEAGEFGLKSDGTIYKNGLWYASYVFDAHVWELFPVITHGHSIYLLEKEKRIDLSELQEYIEENNISIATIPPILLTDEYILPLEKLVVAGDVTNPQVMALYKEHGVDIINAYGPTEGTVCATLHHYNEDGNPLNIGKAIGNMTAYVLDKNLRQVPVGVIGELYIGGAGIARGYLNRPELTEERFMLNPFQTAEQKERGENGRLYKTGDLVRWLSHGELEYIGRNDFQVKIRGYRIELGEIENRLLQYSDIRQAAVLAKENNDGMKYLAAYYVSDSSIDPGLLFDFLSEVLPDYMLPSAFVHLTVLPLTINGKLDRKQLPEPDFTGNKKQIIPENELQAKLCDIYGEVLKIDPASISIHDDFFRLGGNSIMAIKLIGKIKQELKLQIGVTEVFNHKTIASLSTVLADENNTGEQIIITPVKVDSPEKQRLSFAQERLWFIESYEGGSSAYNIPITTMLDKNIQLDLLQKSLELIIMRHEVLRSMIRTTEDGMGYQVVTDLIPEFKITAVKTREELEENINRCANKVFRVEEELPVAVNVFSLENNHYLSVVVHHIAFDGWSTDVFLKELATMYYKLSGREIAELPPLKVQYKDFALWQRNYLAGERLDKQIDYWKNKLDDFHNLDLPTDFRRPSQISYEGENLYFSLDAERGEKLRNLSKELGVSLYSLMLGGYYLMLSAYSGQDDIVVGSPIANRHHAGLEDIIGFFVNTLALRESIDPEQTLKDFILQVSKSITEAQSHQDLPFEKLVEELGVEQDTSRHPIFQVMFGLQSFGGGDAKVNDEDILFYPFDGEVDYQAAKFDLTTMVDDHGGDLRIMFNYAKSLFKKDTIVRMAGSYQLLLDQLIQVDIHDTRVCSLSLLKEEEYKMTVESWNDTREEYAKDLTVHQLFENQVLKTPDQTAVVYQDVRLSYRELNDRSNRLAHYLLEIYKLQPDDIIPLCLDRSEYMLIAILAVMKTGAAYVPMDPSYPADRIKHILQDTDAKLVLGQESTTEKLEDLGVDCIALDEVNIKAQLELTESNNPVTQVNSDNLAYVIYTSGTTGLPKGVMIEHSGVINLIKSMIKAHRLEEFQEVGCYSNYVFDAFVYEALTVLCNGNTLWVYSNDLRTSVGELNEYIRENNIEVSFIPPVLLREVVNNGTHLKLIFAGGESFPALDKNIENIILVNEYGPTEGTVCATLHYYKEDGNPLNIGGPIGNMTTYVLDNHMRAVPVGAVGEFYIGGAGIARGYLNRPDLTEERFLENPFQTLSQKGRGENSRLYKTGDLVRWLVNGELEYVGRNDFQVKIRGYRIELGEIENTLLHYPGIRQTAVLAKENKAGMKYLAGYYVSDVEVDSNLLSEHLSESLPEYMVPGAFVHLTALPLTINGKLDRRQLPEPEFTGSKDYIAPQTDLQAKLCQIYGDVLGLDATGISIEDDFFRLGGDSIISIQLVGRIRQQLEVRLSVKEVFTARSVSSLSLLIEEKKQTEGDHILSEQGILEGGVSLLPVQDWFFSQKEQGYLGDFNHWNQAFLINVPELDKELLATSIHHLVERHDAFRLYYPKADGVYTQVYGSVEAVPGIHYLDASGLNPEELSHVFTEWQSGFDIENGPLCQIGYISGYTDGSARIYFALHHLIIDAVSWRIITEDLKNIYQSLEKGDTEYITAHVKGTSYRQWVEAVRSYKTENPESRAQELLYWNATAETVESNNTMLSRFIGKDYHHGHLILSKEMTELLIRKTHHAYHTQINDLLLSALSLSLSGLTGEESHSVLLESHGREEVFGNLDITETVGWFTTMYPLLLKKGKGLSDTVVLTKESLRRIPNNGIGYGSLIGYTERSLPKISFNYLGQLDQEDVSGEKTWFIAAEDSGLGVGSNNRDSHYISINGAVVDGQLRFGVTGYLSEEEITLLSEGFKSHLESIITLLSTEQSSYLTPSDIDYIVEQEQLFGIQEKGEIEGVYLANSLQEGFVYHALNQGDKDDAYRVQLIWDYHSKINEEKLKDSWKRTQAAYPSLRLR